MRKIFNTLKSLLGTVMMVAMLGTASLATSCVDEYDDTEIQNKLKDVQKDLAALTQRVSNLESKLNSEVAALKAMIEDQNVVVSANKVGDNWEIVLSDGTKFTVYGPCGVVDTDTDTDTDVDTYLAPKEDKDGVWYWAIINDTLGEAITEEWLLVDGEKVPVFATQSECEYVAPELKFNVDSEGNLLVSIDGGANWVNSGINANNFCKCEAGDTTPTTPTVECNCIITDVDIWSEPGYAIFTLVDGTPVKVEVAQDGAGIIANIKGGRININYGESKEADLNLKNVVDIAVMEKPEGWRVKIEGSKLVVTAPSQTAVEDGSADAEGYVRLHATSDEGTCKIAKVKVSTSAGLSIEVDVKSGKIVISNSLVVETEDWWGDVYLDWAQFLFGIAPLKTFEADPEGYLETLNSNYEDVWFYGNNLYWGDPYEEGVNETMVLETSIQEAYYMYTYSELPEGEQYVVWVCPMDETGYEAVVEDLVYGYYKPAVNKVEQLGATFCDVEVSIFLSGADTYEFVVDRYQNWENEGAIEGALSEWKMYKPMYAQYGMSYYFGYGFEHVGEIDFEGSLAEFQTDGMYEADLLQPNTKYVLVVLPVEKDKAYEDYTVEDVLMYEFETAGIIAGGNSTITITPTEVTYTSLKASIDYSEDVVAAYWNYFDPANEAVVAGGETLANYMLTNGNVTTTFPTNATKTYGLSVGQSQTLVVMALDSEGKYTIETLEMKTLEMSYSDDTIAIDQIAGLDRSIAVKLSVSGGTVAKYRTYALASYNASYYTEDDIKGWLMTYSDSYYTISTVHLPEGNVTGCSATWDDATSTLTIQSNVYNGTEYIVYAIAQFEDGSWSANMVHASATPAKTLDPFFASTTDEAKAIYEALGNPTVSNLMWDGSNWVDFDYTFENIAEGMTVYAYVSDEETMNGASGPLDIQRAAYVVENGTPFTSSKDSSMNFMSHNGKYIYYVAKDAEGNYYGTFKYSLAEDYETAISK